jgi:serine/threonine-protein kinase
VRALSAITSEHVVSVLDCGELDGETPYIVMERLHGEDLRRLLAREGPLSVYRAIRFALDACAGLSAVHEAGLIHRDLKPANLFVTRSKTRGEVCKIVDFGVAKGQASDATGPGALLGTVRYMAPEQLSNSASVASTTDVYGVGAILFECLTGRPAHDADSPEELMFDILNRDPPLATELRSEISEGLAEAVRCALSRRPSERFQSVVELAEELTRFLPARDSDETARDESGVAPMPARIRRRPVGSRTKIAVGAALLGGVLVGVLISRLGASDAPSTTASPSVPVAQTAGIEREPSPSSASRLAPEPSPEREKLVGAPTGPETGVSDAPPVNASTNRRAAAPVRPPAAVAPGQKTPASPAAVVLDVENPYED